MLHVLANSATNSPPHLKATGAIDASRLAFPSFSCSFYDYFPFSVLPLLVEATQITLTKEKERKCESAGQTYFTHTPLLPAHSPYTHTPLARTHTPASLHLFFYHAQGVVPAHLSLFRDVPTSISTALSPLPLPSSLPCAALHLVTCHMSGDFSQLAAPLKQRRRLRQTETEQQHSPASVNAILCRLFGVCSPPSPSPPLLTI